MAATATAAASSAKPLAGAAASQDPQADLPLGTQAVAPKQQASSPLESELDPRKAPQVKPSGSTQNLMKANSGPTQNLMRANSGPTQRKLMKAKAKAEVDEYDDHPGGGFQWEDSTHPRQRRAEREHFRASSNGSSDAQRSAEREANYMLGHPIWTEEEKHAVEIEHRKCETISDYLAYSTVQMMRFNFDLFSGYFFGNMDESKWLTRIVFLETVAGVPGMVGAMIRHLHSLRLMRRDYGWIHTLLEEAENERMHLLTAMKLKKPSGVFRASVLVTQGIFVNLWFVAYLASPRFCHRFVGYLEEEAVVTYTKCLKELDAGKLPLFQQLEAPPIAKKYWRLGDDAKMRDVLLSMRADESHHRDVNHALASRDPLDPNPFEAGK